METTLRTTRDSDNIVTLWLDSPGKSVNTISPRVIEDLSNALTALAADKPAGVIFASAKKDSFVVGADLFAIQKMDPQAAAKFFQDTQQLYRRIEMMDVPTAAAINGDCLGGGLELALVCRYRVAADGPAVSIGLPETKIGLLPGWGGTTRLPRLIGLELSLDLLLTGRSLSANKALRTGIVDEVVDGNTLTAACKRLLLASADTPRAPRVEPDGSATASVCNQLLLAALAKTRQKTGTHYPAPLKIIEVLRQGYEQGTDAGLRAEIDALLALLETDSTRNLMRLFFLRQGAKKRIAQQIPAVPEPVKQAAVIGGGTMGAGIAYSMARAGLNVRLVEVTSPSAAAALDRVRQVLDDDIAAGRLTAGAAAETLNRVTTCHDWTGLESADLVVEAVIERMDIKREVFGKLDRLTRPQCVLASNTSALSVTELARCTGNQRRVVGLHFFNPVPKMPLVEVVRTPDAGPAALATAIGLAVKLGKTPILVNDAPGFIINRVLMPYLAEALLLAEDGLALPFLDTAMRHWGMPMGPFELMDEIGLDVTAMIIEALAGPLAGRISAPAMLKTAMERKWLGKKSHKGFYIYGEGDKRAGPELNKELTSLVGPDAADTGAGDQSALEEQAQWRMVLPMVNEAARLLEEGVVDSTDAIDLATVLGTGFAPFRGGLAQFASATGAAELVRRLRELSEKHGPRLAPARLLVDLAAAQRPLSEFAAVR